MFFQFDLCGKFAIQAHAKKCPHIIRLLQFMRCAFLEQQPKSLDAQHFLLKKNASLKLSCKCQFMLVICMNSLLKCNRTKCVACKTRSNQISCISYAQKSTKIQVLYKFEVHKIMLIFHFSLVVYVM